MYIHIYIYIYRERERDRHSCGSATSSSSCSSSTTRRSRSCSVGPIYHAMLYYAMLCFAMLCYAILYYTILCYTIFYFHFLYHINICICTGTDRGGALLRAVAAHAARGRSYGPPGGGADLAGVARPWIASSKGHPSTTEQSLPSPVPAKTFEPIIGLRASVGPPFPFQETRWTRSFWAWPGSCSATTSCCSAGPCQSWPSCCMPR